MNANENQIVVYQPNETVRLDVRLENETVWLTQEQIANLFGTKRPAITKHLANIYKSGELEREGTCSILEHMGNDGRQSYRTMFYNLDAILSVGYRVNSRNATLFRRWATQVLKAYLLKGYAVNERMNQLEDKVDRRLAKHDSDIAELKEKVDFFVQTKEPPLQGVFFDGQLCDTFDLTEKSDALPGIFPENSERAARQKKLDIRVILGNPPYNVSKGTTYRNLEDRIAETYAQGTDAVNKNSLYDSYIKAFRWASDRIKDKGVVAFVTNGGWLDAQAMNGFRNSLVKEFDHIYVFNLRGNQRTQGETSRREGGKIFGSGSRTPVAITILVKTGRAACPHAAAKEAKGKEVGNG